MRLAVFASHPIQYQAPIWRRLAKHKGLDLLVHYFSDMSVRGGIDPGFGVPVAWDQPLLEGYEHIFLSYKANLDLSLQVTAPDFNAYMGERHFDAALVNGYEYGFELQLRRCARGLDCPLILRPELSTIPAHGWLRRSARSVFRRWFYAGVTAFGVIGEQARRSLLAAGVSPEKMFSSPYAVDSDLFESSDAAFDRESCRRLLGVSAYQFVLLFSGKLIPRKNPLLVLKALQQMPERERVTFVVLGDGPDRFVLEQEGNRLLGKNFVLAGFKNQSHLAPYFKAADALVLPSHYETWGLVVNEAMHFGLPVVVSDTAGCAADLVENRETGMRFRSNDAADLAQALGRIIGNRPLLWKFSRNARRIIRSYTTDTATKGIVDAVEYCLRVKRSPRVYSSLSANA